MQSANLGTCKVKRYMVWTVYIVILLGDLPNISRNSRLPIVDGLEPGRKSLDGLGPG